MTETKKKILAIDNDLSFLKILSEWFEFQGFDIITTDNGNSALKLLENDHFDAIILDVVMGPPSGLDILKQIKSSQNTKDIPVFMLSQMGEQDHQDRARELGAEDYLVKANFRLKDLTTKIQKVT